MSREPARRGHGGKHYRPKKRRKNVYLYDQLKEWQGWNLDRKIRWSNAVIEKALDKLKTPSIAFSGGKDSTVLLDLVRRKKPDVAVIYGNTTIEFPECVKFSMKLAFDWDLNFYEAYPEVSFWWCVRNYGWPIGGKSFGVGGVAHKDSRRKFFADLEAKGELKGNYRVQAEVEDISSACCTFLKERPSIKIQKRLGVDGVFLGILASESRRRMFNFLEYGELYFPKSQKVWKCHPLAIWTDDDIWEYIRKFNVPYASLYDMGYHDDDGKWISHKRNGCMWCAMDLKYPNNHLSIMRRTHPRAWRTGMIKMGLGEILKRVHDSIYRQYDMFMQVRSLEEYLEEFPCAFDRI